MYIEIWFFDIENVRLIKSYLFKVFAGIKSKFVIIINKRLFKRKSFN